MSLWTSLRDAVISVVPGGQAMAKVATAAASALGLPGAPSAAPGSGAITSAISMPSTAQVINAASVFASSTPIIPALPITTGASNMASPGIFSTALGAAASIGLGGLKKIGNTVYSATGKILHVIVGGMKVTPRKAKALAKQIGLDAAAAALGISAVELAQMVLSDSARTSRGNSRGISGADLRRTRRTMNKIKSINKYLHLSALHRAPSARRKSC